jgi:hypothetical protein
MNNQQRQRNRKYFDAVATRSYGIVLPMATFYCLAQSVSVDEYNNKNA